MPVFHWMHHHRLWSVGGGFAVLLVLALGGLWFFLVRSPGTQVDLRQALAQYRLHQRAGQAVRTALLPPSGVYTFTTSGGEQLSVAGISRAFPATTRMVVTEGRCATEAWEPLQQHTEQMVVCPSDGTGLTMTTATTHESIAGQRTTSTIHCGAGAYVVPPAGAWHTWQAACRAPGQAITLHGELLGVGTVVIDGHRIPVEHTRVTLDFKGAQTGTNPTDYWVSTTDRLIVREAETVDLTQQAGVLGEVRFTEQMAVSLVSTTPAR
jgi:hypothetical protein